MIRRALLLVLLLSSCVLTASDPQRFKNVTECDQEWNAWADRAMPNYRTIKQDYDTLEARYSKLEDQNADLRSSNESLNHSQTAIGIMAASVGIGIGIMCAFWLVRGLKRLWPVSHKAKQLVFMVCGAVWITAAGLMAVNDSDLSRHPVNMLFTVLVYSLPALAFGGIGFWWFGKPKQEPTQ